MKYNLKRKLFTSVLLNENGKALNLKNSPFSIEKKLDTFTLKVGEKVVSPKFASIEHSKTATYGITPNNEKCKIDLTQGKVSPSYLRKLGKYYVLSNGEIVKFNTTLNPVRTKLFAVISYANKIKYPSNMYNKIVVKNAETNKFGVMDENGNIVCPCIFNSESIWFNFAVERKFPANTTNPLQMQKTECLSSYTADKITKLFNETQEVIYVTNNTESIFKVAESKNAVTLSIYDAESDYSRIHTYNFTTKQLKLSALIKGFAVKYEKIDGDTLYGASKNKNNRLTLVDFRGKAISDDQFETLSFEKFNKKTVAVVSKNGKYGIFDMRSRAYIVEPIKTCAEIQNVIKQNNAENIK